MRRWFPFVAMAIFPAMVLAGQFDKMPEACKKEMRDLVEDNRTLKLERDALKEELVQLREQVEKGRAVVGDDVRPLADGEKSSEGYGETRWGMSTQEVTELISGAKGGKDEDLLSFAKQVADLPAVVHLGFVQGRLASVEVEFHKARFGRLESLVEEYNRIKDLLSEKYDSPRLDETDLKARGNAVGRKKSGSGSRIELTTTWETDKTEIVLNCQGDVRNARMKIAYDSKEMALAEKQRLLKDL